MAKQIARSRLDELEREFIAHYVETGDARYSVERVWGRQDVDFKAKKCLKDPLIAAAIHDAIAHRVRTHGARLALSVLEAACTADKATWATRVDAAKTLLDRAGLPAQRARDPDKAAGRQLSDYSVDELQALVDRLAAERADNAVDVTPASATDPDAPFVAHDSAQVDEIIG